METKNTCSGCGVEFEAVYSSGFVFDRLKFRAVRSV